MNHLRIARVWAFGNTLSLLCTVLASGVLYTPSAMADTKYASKERSTIARAHMSRARTLLVEALAEFEEGRKYARPDLLLDSEDWRLRVVSLTEQLNRVIDPKPRVTREGAVFRAPPRLVKREKDGLPPVSNAARSRSDHGEKERLKERQEARARLYEDKASGEKVPEEKVSPKVSEEESGGHAPKAEGQEARQAQPKNETTSIDELLNDLEKDLEFEDRGSEPQGNIAPPKASYDEPLKAPSRKGDETFFDDEDFEDTSAERRVGGVEDDLDALPNVISDQELERISPEVADSRLIEDEELTRRLERSLSER